MLLANKEALVAWGALVTRAAAKAGPHALLPVDSEHSAIFQCLQGAAGNPIHRLYLTCSGGPFRTWAAEDIRAATPQQALKHPNWVMGQKITIDSATLFNKALEIIEAKWLFHVEQSRIQVMIHPQSVVHSAVGFEDGSILAQLGTPDMRLPILYAMSYPRRLPTGGPELDLFSLGSLTFEQPDPRRFPSLRMAGEAPGARRPACSTQPTRRCRSFTIRRRESHGLGPNLWWWRSAQGWGICPSSLEVLQPAAKPGACGAAAGGRRFAAKRAMKLLSRHILALSHAMIGKERTL